MTIDRRTELEWLRDYLRTSLAEADVANRAALAKQYRDTLAELVAIATPEEGDPLDDLLASGPSATVTPIPKRTGRSSKRRAAGD